MGLNLLYEYVSLFYHSPVHPLAKLTPHAGTHDRTHTHYKVSKTKKMVHVSTLSIRIYPELTTSALLRSCVIASSTPLRVLHQRRRPHEQHNTRCRQPIPRGLSERSNAPIQGEVRSYAGPPCAWV